MSNGKRHIAVVLLITGITVISLILIAIQSTEADPAPHQPIDFFHTVHARDNGIACGFCHRTAETEAFAGMPSTQTCITCHRVVIPNVPEIWKLRSYWELGEAIPWKRTHDLPAHAYFSHEAHTAGGKMGCEPCHGKVEEMDRVRQVKPLTMGWCLDCHRQENASTECWSCHR